MKEQEPICLEYPAGRAALQRLSVINRHDGVYYYYYYYYYGQMAGACEYGNELSSSIKCGEFLD
jgi:hypothetical protein